MKCRSPFVWILQCLKSIWRSIFGRKRSGSGSGQALLSATSTQKAAFSGITIDTILPATSTGLQLANEDAWNGWNPDGQSSRDASKNPYSTGNQQVAGPKTSAADAWRQSLLQQKAAPPEPVEEPNFFDSMAPTVHKQKIVRLRTESEEAVAQSSRLAFNAEAPRVNQFDWMEDEVPAGNWETGIDDLDPKEIRKAQRKAQSSTTASHSGSSRPK